jgi:CheY-like chemotaxis protein
MQAEALAARAAHDFNIIFAALTAQSELMSKGLELPDSATQSIARILRCAQRGVELSAKFAGMARNCSPGPNPVDLNHFLPRATAFLARNLGGAGTVQYLQPEGVQLRAFMDEVALRQALLFLAFNARDAASLGAEITLRLASAHRECSCGGNMACFAMTDLRPEGLSEEELAHCNGNAITSEFSGGLDMGLVAARRIIIRHGGRLVAENIQPKGVRFHVCLPVATATAAAFIDSQNVSALGQAACDASGDKPQLLVVDDETLVRSVIRTALTMRGYKVTEAANGSEALEKFKKARPPFDLVFMDVGLPDMDGWTVLERMRAISSGVPILMTSGDTADEQLEKHAEDARVLFLAKPFANEDLLMAVRQALARKTKPVA